MLPVKFAVYSKLTPLNSASGEDGSHVVRILPPFHVHYRVHNSPPHIPILSQINPVHALSPHFLQIQFNVLPSTPRSSNWSLTIRSPHHNPLCTSPLPHTCYMRPLSHFSWSNLATDVGWRDAISSSLLSLSSSRHPILEHTQPMFVPHCERPSFKPIKTAGSITVRHILRFTQRPPSNCTTMDSH